MSRGPLQIPHEVRGFGSVGGLGKSLESSSEYENDGSGELHDEGREIRGKRPNEGIVRSDGPRGSDFMYTPPESLARVQGLEWHIIGQVNEKPERDRSGLANLYKR